MNFLDEFKIETSQIGKLKYVIRYPKEYQKDNKSNQKVDRRDFPGSAVVKTVPALQEAWV